MSFCGFADGALMFEYTPVENMFLIEQMPDAPSDALKVYLYARMFALYPKMGEGMADLAKALRMTEDEVYNAFAYWERRGLVRRLSDHPPTYEFLSLRDQMGDRDAAMDKLIYSNREFNNRMMKLFDGDLIENHELHKAEDWRDILKIEEAAVLRLLEYGIETSRVKKPKKPKPASVFKRIDDKLSGEWADRGIHTLEDVERAIADEEGVQEIFKKLGLYRKPTPPELATVRKWTGEWGFDREAILSACQETVKARNPSVGYLDAILKNRMEGDEEARQGLVEVLRELDPRNTQPTPDQLKRYRALLDGGFAPEMIRLAAVQCHRRGKHALDDVEWRLDVWRKGGVSTPEEADAFMKQMGALSRELRALYKRAGYDDRRPGYGDLETYRAWKDAYPEALIEYAAECAKNAGGSVAYMDKLLTAWGDAGATTVEAARAEHAAHAAKPADGEKPANPALDYTQREYREEDFGDDFYFDYDKVFGSKEDKK